MSDKKTTFPVMDGWAGDGWAGDAADVLKETIDKDVLTHMDTRISILPNISRGTVAMTDSVKRQLTHIEIRRAQNGFVVRGVQTSMGYEPDGNQVFYVCETVESLTNLLSSLARDEGDYVWGIGHDLKYEDIFKEKKP